HTMMFNQARLGITPESFKAVDVDSATGEALAMVNVDMPVATKSQGIVDTELVGIDQATALDLAEGLFHQCLRFDVRHDGHRHAPAPLQNAENRYFPGRCPTAFSFPATPEIRFIGLHLTLEQRRFRTGENGPPNEGIHPPGGRITDADLDGGLMRRHLEFEQLDEPQPRCQGHFRLSQPDAGQQSERVTAASAPVVTFTQAVGFLVATGVTKNAAIFVTPVTHQPLRRRGPGNKLFKGLEIHDTSLNLVPNLLQSPYSIRFPPNETSHHGWSKLHTRSFGHECGQSGARG